jgi:UDP-N-acetylglucosamine 2-epimerase (non-hydrolysing)
MNTGILENEQQGERVVVRIERGYELKIAIILGTRPEIIKMSPVIRECERRGIEYYILHTGQHYSYEMDRIFFEQLKLPAAKYNLDVGSGLHGAQTGKMLAGIEEILMQDTPDVVLVQGDTNTVLAGALAASKLHIRIGHVEAACAVLTGPCPKRSTASWPTIFPIIFLHPPKPQSNTCLTKAYLKTGSLSQATPWSMRLPEP